MISRVVAPLVAMLAVSAIAPVASADVPALWVSRFSSLRGDDACAYGAADCNRCVYEVERQFRDLTQRTKHTRRIKEWEWDRGRSYAPYGMEPTDTLSMLPAELDDLSSRHFQSLVRIANESTHAPDLFASYSGEDSVVFASKVNEDPAGRLTDGPLKYMFEGSSVHPGGMAAIGKYLLVAHEEEETSSSWTPSSSVGWLDVFDTRSMPNGEAKLTFLKDSPAAANVAAVKLAGGGYLVAVNVTSYHNNYRFYYASSLDALELEPMWQPAVKSDWDTGWHGDGGYENLSFVTECGSKKIYAVGSTGQGSYRSGEGVWSLFEVTMQGAPALKHVANNTRDMYSAECDTRGSGSAYAGRFGELGLYCQQKLQNADVRRSGALCAVSVGLGIPFASEAFCADALSASTRIAYTEFWPTKPTPEYAAFLDRTVAVTIHSFEAGGGSVGIVDRRSGQVCQTREGSITRCEFHVLAGEQVELVPFLTDEASSLQTWWNNQCVSRNDLVQRELESHAGSCTLTIQEDTAITLGATTRAARNNGGGSGGGPNIPGRPDLDPR